MAEIHRNGRIDGACCAALLLMSAVICAVPIGCASLTDRSDTTDSRLTKIVLLGTGNPNAEPDRMGASTAIVVGDTPYLVDFGPGVVRRASAAAEMGIDALRVDNLKHAFVTHLHTDHTIGYADLIFTPWVLERDEPLKVFGPPGIQRMTDHVLAAYEEDVSMRLHGMQPANPDGYRVEVTEIEQGIVYRDEQVTVEAFRVPHGTWEYAFGYKFTTPDRTIVLSGDTGPFDAMVEIARGADVLIHEAYATYGFNLREPEWQRYHAVFHTSASKVGEIAAEAGVGMVILTHQLLWGATEEQMIEEVRAKYKGPVYYGRDLDVY